MANRQVFPSSLFPLRGDISAEAGATSVIVQGLQGIPIIAPPVEPVGLDTLFYDSYNNDWFYASPWDIPVGIPLVWEGYGYGSSGISWIAPDTLAFGNGTDGDVSGAAAMTALVLFGSQSYYGPYSDYDVDYGPSYDQFYTSIFSGATQNWNLILPPNPGASDQVLTTNGTGVTYWSTAATSTPAGLDTQVQFNNGGVFGASSNFVFNSTGPQTTWNNILNVANGGNVTIGRSSGGSEDSLEIHTAFANGESIFAHSNTAFRAPTLTFSRSNGTQASPTAVTGAGELGYITFNGYDGSTYAEGAQIVCQTGTAWSTGIHSSTIYIMAVPAQSTTPAQVFRFNSNTDNGGDYNCNASSLNLSIGGNSMLNFTSGISGYEGFRDCGISRVANASMAMGTGVFGNVAATVSMGKLLANYAVFSAIAASGAPTITTGGSAGTTTWTYVLVAKDAAGNNIASASGSTTTGNATLNATNFNVITVSSPSVGAVSYDVYRTVVGASPVTTGKIGVISTASIAGENSNVLEDTGLAGNSAAVPANTVTSGINNAGTYTDSTGAAGTSGQLLSSTVTGTAWVLAPTLPVPGSTGDILYNNGGVLGAALTTITAAGSITIPDTQVIRWTGSAYSGVGLSPLAADTLAVGNGTESDVSGAMAMTAIILYGASYYSAYDAFHTTIYSGATQNWNLVLPETAGVNGQVLVNIGSGFTEWESVSALGVPWSALTNPTANLSLTMGTDTTTFNYATGLASAWTWQNNTPTVTGASTTVALSTSTAPTHSGGVSWTYTLAATETGAGSNGWVNALVTISGYTGGATGNNGVSLLVTASTTTTVTIQNATGTTINTGTPVMISSAVSSSPVLQIAGTVNTGTAGTLNSAADVWSIQNVLGSVAPNPTSTLTLTHTGSTGIAAFSLTNPTAQTSGGGLLSSPSLVLQFNQYNGGSTPSLWTFTASGTAASASSLLIAESGGSGASGSTVGITGSNVDLSVGAAVAGTSSTGSVYCGTVICPDGTNYKMALSASAKILKLSSDSEIAWYNNASYASGSADSGISRISAGILGIGTGAQGSIVGSIQCSSIALNGAVASPTAGVYYSGTNAGITQTAEAVGTLATTGGIVTTFTAVSDERLKTAQAYKGGLKEILAITPIKYRWNEIGSKYSGQSTERDFIGFSAQNVRKVIPEAVWVSKDDYLGFDDRPVIAALVCAIKELHAIIKKQDERIEQLEEKLDSKKDLKKWS